MPSRSHLGMLPPRSTEVKRARFKSDTEVSSQRLASYISSSIITACAIPERFFPSDWPVVPRRSLP